MKTTLQKISLFEAHYISVLCVEPIKMNHQTPHNLNLFLESLSLNILRLIYLSLKKPEPCGFVEPYMVNKQPKEDQCCERNHISYIIKHNEPVGQSQIFISIPDEYIFQKKCNLFTCTIFHHPTHTTINTCSNPVLLLGGVSVCYTGY